jgi:hypothetical protein
MTKRLEEVFNLPEFEDESKLIDDTGNDENEEHADIEESDDLIPLDQSEEYSNITEIEKSLASVIDIDSTDTDMDNYAAEAMEAFGELMSFGKQLSDKDCADVFNAANRMMGNAITAKKTKMERKLRSIQLQLQTERLKLDREKLSQKDKKVVDGDTDSIPAKGVMMTRSQLLEMLSGRDDENDK